MHGERRGLEESPFAPSLPGQKGEEARGVCGRPEEEALLRTPRGHQGFPKISSCGRGVVGRSKHRGKGCLSISLARKRRPAMKSSHTGGGRGRCCEWSRGCQNTGVRQMAKHFFEAVCCSRPCLAHPQEPQCQKLGQQLCSLPRPTPSLTQLTPAFINCHPHSLTNAGWTSCPGPGLGFRSLALTCSCFMAILST